MTADRRPQVRIARMVLPVLMLLSLIAANHAVAQTDVAAYYPTWRHWALPAEEIDFETVTEIRHAFAWPSVSGTLELSDGMPYPDLIDYATASNVPVLLSVGGASNSTFFTSTLGDPVRRATFINDLVTFCDTHGYFGVDIDWEFPYSTYDRDNLRTFVEELRGAFDAVNPGWRITMAVPASAYLQQHFDLEGMAPYVNRYSVMTYDYNGWNSIAGHNAPLWTDEFSTCDNGSVDYSMQVMLDQTDVPPGMLQMGLPFYGRRYAAESLCDSTSLAAYTIYEDIATLRDNEEWHYVWDEAAGAPLLWSPEGDEFFSFDDPATIMSKVQYALDLELGGVMIWAIGQDDVDGEQELLNAVANVLEVREDGPDAVLPDQFALHPPRPNPFNSGTEIRFSLEQPERVTLTVYDVTGRRVARLAEGAHAAGTHRIGWSPARLASGVYLLVLDGERSAPVARKAVLLR